MTVRIEKVGAIYVRSFPTDAAIALNGEPAKNKTGIFQQGTLLNGLFPRRYALELSSPGYKVWRQTVQVEPALVTEIKYAVLIPDQPTELIPRDIREFWLAGRQLVALNSSATLILAGGDIVPGSAVVGQAREGARILTTNAAGTYFWVDPENATSTNLSVLLRSLPGRPTGRLAVAADPENPGQAIVQGANYLGLLDMNQRSLLSIATSSAYRPEAAAASRFWLAWSRYDSAKNESQLMLFDKFLRTNRLVGELTPGRITQLEWSVGNMLGIARADGEFYLYVPGEPAYRHLASDVRDFEFGGDGRMLALRGGNSLEVFDLEDKDEYWRFNLPQMDRVRQIVWHKTGRNIFIVYPGETRLLSLDDAGLENFAVVAETGQVAYAARENRLYFLKDSAISYLKFAD